MTAEEIIAALGLQAHPEGGHFCETWRGPAMPGPTDRAAGTAIYYLLRAGERSHWHRVDAAEIWHYYAGDALELRTTSTGDSIATHVLGPDLAAGQRPQHIIETGVWQSARTTGSFTLVGCTVSPGFEFAGFELAAPGLLPD